jgi:hypothetical protein
VSYAARDLLSETVTINISYIHGHFRYIIVRV